jgi:tetratricopeptide (TPR) repeat protein
MPTIAEAFAVAVEQHQAGRLNDAEQIYRQILAVDPRHADALHLLGVIGLQTGKPEVAVQYIGQAIELNAAEPTYFSNLGNAYKALGQLDKAVAAYLQALQLKPDLFEAYNNLGAVFQAQGNLEEALSAYHRALALNTNHAQVHSNIGTALHEQGKLDEAIGWYRRALEVNPRDAATHNNLGNALMAQGKLKESVDSFNRAVELNPMTVSPRKNLGNCQLAAGDFEAASISFRRVLEQIPNEAVVHGNLGTALRQLGQFDDAIRSYATAIKLNPDCSNALYGKASLKLLMADFDSGWPEYEACLQVENLRNRPISKPKWEGEPLEARTLLLHCEQGLGDTIQFVRYAAMLKKMNNAGTIVVECQRVLLKLLSTCPGIDHLVAQGAEVPPFDIHALLLSVPAILRTSLEFIPAEIPYLFADQQLMMYWRDKLAGLSRPQIGINWRGLQTTGHRDIPFKYIRMLAALPGVQLISLQKGERRDELIAANHDGLPILDFGDNLDVMQGAFMDTAAIMMNMDLVITSDTAIPHLAGALGVPVWLALPYVPEWRWLLNRSDSPWYPTMRLFRQKQPGDWTSVFEEIRVALREKFGI